MSVTIKVEGLESLRAGLKGFSERRLASAAATGLTRGAKRVAGAWQDEIDARIDRPVARTQSATGFKGADINRPAEVFVKDRQTGTAPASYLSAQERGGKRLVKQFEKALIASGAMPAGFVTVPGKGGKLDSYGNVSRSLIIAVIAQLGQDYTPGYARVISKSATKRLATAAKRGQKFIVVRPGEERQANADAGIYERQSDGRRKAVFLFRRAVTYSKRIDLLGKATQGAVPAVRAEVLRAVDESAARLASRGGA